jgi:hypothetical protein
VLWEISGPKGEEVAGEWRNCIVRSFITFTPHQILLELSDKGELVGGHGI